MKFHIYQVAISIIAIVMIYQGIAKYIKGGTGQTFLKVLVRVVVWGGMALIAINKDDFNDDVIADFNLNIDKEKLVEKRAIEVGDIYSLGYKFSKPFNLTYKDENGKEELVYMGSYGMSPSRLTGAIVELNHDEKGIIWPENVAPLQIHLLSLDENEEAEKIYAELSKKGIEVLFDDREVSAGEKFADSDLIGIPWRVVVSKKSLAAGGIEVKKRSESESKIISIDELLKEITINK